MRTIKQPIRSLVLQKKEIKTACSNERYFILKLIRKIFFVFSFCILSLTSHGQDTISKQIDELNGKLTDMQGSNDSTIKAKGNYLANLIYDLHHTIYAKEGSFSSTAIYNPIRVNTDVQSLPLLKDTNNLYKNIQLICIRIQDPADLQMILNISDLSGFKNLKYICFLCDFKICPEQTTNVGDCEIEKISTMIQGNGNPELEILYTSSNVE